MPYPPGEYPGEREYKCDGGHLSRKIKYLGPVCVEICADPCCAKLFAQCEHAEGVYPDNKSICEWNSSTTLLTCSFCGKDVT